jgi:hypothetical protein
MSEKKMLHATFKAALEGKESEKRFGGLLGQQAGGEEVKRVKNEPFELCRFRTGAGRSRT